jgi:hypothetical protein
MKIDVMQFPGVRAIVFGLKICRVLRQHDSMFEEAARLSIEADNELVLKATNKFLKAREDYIRELEEARYGR